MISFFLSRKGKKGEIREGGVLSPYRKKWPQPYTPTLFSLFACDVRTLNSVDTLHFSYTVLHRGEP
jgi:hypothetical protein